MGSRRASRLSADRCVRVGTDHHAGGAGALDARTRGGPVMTASRPRVPATRRFTVARTDPELPPSSSAASGALA